jgi:hypothetical protein
LEGHAKLLEQFEQIPSVRLRQSQPGYFDVEHRVPSSQSLGDVMAAGSVFSEPIVAKIDELHGYPFRDTSRNPSKLNITLDIKRKCLRCPSEDQIQEYHVINTSHYSTQIVFRDEVCVYRYEQV